jgi:hypothetical protein
MKIFMTDELYDYIKTRPDFNEFQAAYDKLTYGETIREELEAQYNSMTSGELAEYLNKVKSEVADRPDLVRYINYTSDISVQTLMTIVNDTSLPKKDKMYALLRLFTYSYADGIHFEYVVDFVTMYNAMSTEELASLPSYIHVNYIELNGYYLYKTMQDNHETFDTTAYDKLVEHYKTVKEKVKPYYSDADVIDNIWLEVQAYFIRLLHNDLTNTAIDIILERINLDHEKLTNKYKYVSLGVMWLYEMYMETSFNASNYHGFILWAFKLFRYIDSALADHDNLFDGLRFYDKVNIIAFAIIVRRLLNIKEVFVSIVQLRLFNLDFTDELFLAGEGVTNVNLTSKPSRDAMLSFKNYVDVWFNNNKPKLIQLRDDSATMEDFRAIIRDYLHSV